MITGTVRDHMGKPLNNATIGLLGTGFLTNSDKKGVFRLKDVPFGKYVFQASCDGYAGLEMQIEFTGNLHVVATLENRVINPGLTVLPFAGSFMQPCCEKNGFAMRKNIEKLPANPVFLLP